MSRQKKVNFEPATSEQLAQIDSLSKDLRRLHGIINWPKSTVIVVTLNVIAIYYLVLSKNGLLNPLYLYFCNMIDSHIESTGHGLIKNIEIFQNEYKRTAKKYAGLVCDYFEKMEVLPKSSNCRPLIIEIFQQGNDPLRVNEVAEQLKIPASIMQEVADRHFKTKSEWTYSIINEVLPRIRNIYIDKIAQVFLSATVFLGQKFIIDPILYKISSGQISLTLKPYILYQEDNQAAEQKIIELKQKQEKLTQQAKKYKIISYSLSMLALPIAFFNFMEREGTNPFVSLGCISTLVLTGREGWRDLRNWQKSRNLNIDLKNGEKFLNTICSAVEQKWVCHKSTTLETSYFSISLRKFKNLSEKMLAVKLKYYLAKNNFQTQPVTRNCVILTADEVIKHINNNSIVSKFKNALLRLQVIQYTSKQFKALIALFNQKIRAQIQMIEYPYQDPEDLPVTDIYFLFSGEGHDYAANLFETYLKKISTISKVESKIDSDSALISKLIRIDGHSYLDEKSTFAFKNKILSLPVQTAKNSLTTPTIRCPKSLPMPSPEIKNPQIHLENKIYWGADCYDPEDKQCPVKLMRGPMSQNRHFLIFKLSKHHLPAGYPDALLESLREFTQQAKLGAIEQGCKFISGYLGNDLTTGETAVPFSMKFRRYGKFGDMRLFARSETNGSKILHRVVSLEPHYHK